jgi:hypothetical protein
MDASFATVSPGHGNFFYFKTELASEEEYLGVESPALDFLHGKDRIDRAAFKCLEAALGIGEVKAEGEAQKQVENAAEKLAVQGLAPRLGFRAQPARADGDIGSRLERLKKLWGFFDGRRKVSVAKEDDGTLGVKHAVADTVSLAAITGILHQMHNRIFGGKGMNDFGGVVARAVINNDDFAIPALGVDVGEHFLEGCA